MERKLYLNRYRLCVDQVGIPVVIRRSAGEATFQADDTESGGQVAVQAVPAAALRTAVREQLYTEARAAQELKHVNIPVLHDFGFNGEQLIYVTEYFEGTTAEDWVKAQGPMPSSVVLRIASQVVGALGAATFHGIVHHAVHPGNIMLVPGQTAEGEWPLIKVLNFVGVAPALAASGTGEPEPMNPADFASPEQLENGAVDFRSQIYSLGCTLWFLLKGVPPLGGAAAVQSASGLAAPIRRLLLLMLANDPAERPLDPLAFHQQIQDCLAQIERRSAVASKFGLPVATPVSAPAKTVKATPRRPIPWKPLALAAILLTIATLTAVVLAGRSRQHQAIGVPVGVPEASNAPALAKAAAPRSSAPIAIVNNPVATQELSEPPVLTSTAVANDEGDEGAESSSNAAAPYEAERATQIAANDAPTPTPSLAPAAPAPPVHESRPQSTALVASHSPSVTAAGEPAAPAEGPAEEPMQRTEPTAEVASAAPSSSYRDQPNAGDSPSARSSAAEEDVQKDVAISAVNPLPEKSTKVAKAARQSAKKVRVAAASNSAPPLPRGAVRAQYLGTTPEGNLIFGLPSNERGYVSPPAVREEQRRSRRAVRDPLKELPVLPALPPDE